MAMPLVNWALNCGTQRFLPKAWWAVKDVQNEAFNNSAHPDDNAKEVCNSARAGSGCGRERKAKQEEGNTVGVGEGEFSGGRGSRVHANSRCGLSVQRLHVHAFLCASIGVLCEDPNRWPQLAAFMVAACL